MHGNCLSPFTSGDVFVGVMVTTTDAALIPCSPGTRVTSPSVDLIWSNLRGNSVNLAQSLSPVFKMRKISHLLQISGRTIPESIILTTLLHFGGGNHAGRHMGCFSNGAPRQRVGVVDGCGQVARWGVKGF